MLVFWNIKLKRARISGDDKKLFPLFLLYGMEGENYFWILDYLYENVQWISIHRDVFLYIIRTFYRVFLLNPNNGGFPIGIRVKGKKTFAHILWSGRRWTLWSNLLPMMRKQSGINLIENIISIERRSGGLWKTFGIS